MHAKPRAAVWAGPLAVLLFDKCCQAVKADEMQIFDRLGSVFCPIALVQPFYEVTGKVLADHTKVRS